MTTYAGTATASRADVWLIFRTWSLTLDFASIIETAEVVAAVERARVKASALLAFGATWMRIFAADERETWLFTSWRAAAET